MALSYDFSCRLIVTIDSISLLGCLVVKNSYSYSFTCSNSEKQVEVLEGTAALYEAVDEDEENAFNVDVEYEMTVDNVLAQIVERLSSLNHL